VFVLELHATNLHNVLGRLLDQTRVAGLTLAAVSASMEAGGYRIRATLDVRDRDIVDRLGYRVGGIIGVGGLEVRQQCSETGQAPPPRRAEAEDAASAR
jgi:hypothetical protein